MRDFLKKFFLGLIVCLMMIVSFSTFGMASEKPVNAQKERKAYTVGVDDILSITVTRPESIEKEVTVAPDGAISFPYIGAIYVKGKSLAEIQNDVVSALSDGYMKYPLVTVTLVQSLSRKFFVYGEVVKPGNYPMQENTTVLRAISISGGFTKYGSSSKVKILRERENGGYQTIKVNVKDLMDGDSDKDVSLEPGDIVVVSEGVF